MQVPRYTRQVESNNVGVRYNTPVVADAYGSGVGQAVGNAGRVLGQEVQQLNEQKIIEQKTANNINVRDNLSKALDEYNNGYSDIMSLKGQNVLAKKEEVNGQQIDTLSASQQAKKLANETREKYMASFDNDVARNAFAQTFDSNVSGTQRQVLEHERTQSNIAAVDSHKALENTLANTFLTNISTGNTEGANAAMLTAIDSNSAIGNSLGWSPETKDMNKQIMQNAMVSNAVTTLLKDKKVDEAEKWLNYYGDKLDEKTKLTLDAAIIPQRIKRDTELVVNDVFGRYGLDDQRGARKYLKEAYGDNPGYKNFLSAIDAKYSDEKMLKNQEDKQKEETILLNVRKSGTLSDALDVIHSSGLPPSKQLYLENQAKSKFKSLSGKPTPDQTYWHNYERTGLTSDIENMRLYEKRTQEGGEPTPEQQKSANISAARLNAYWQFSTGGSYNPNAKQKETIPLDEYQLLKSKGFTDEQIASEYLTDGVE